MSTHFLCGPRTSIRNIKYQVLKNKYTFHPEFIFARANYNDISEFRHVIHVM